MLNRLRAATVLAGISLLSVCKGARYDGDIRESSDGAWVFSYLVILVVGAMYVSTEWRKGSVFGFKAAAIVAVVAAAAYVFPIINGLLVLAAALVFAYGMFKKL